MTKTTRLLGVGVAFALCAAALAVLGPITLKNTPKVGDDPAYKMNGKISIGGQEINVSADVDYKTTKVDTDGSYTTVSTQKNLTIEVGGQSFSPPGSEASSTTVSKASGEIVTYESSVPNPDGLRTSMINNFIFPDKPVDVGDEWNFKVKADDKKGLMDATSTFKVDSLEKIGKHDTVKIKASYKETSGSEPASSEGFMWIDTADGSLVKANMTWNNVPSPQGAISGPVSLERVD